MLGNLILARYLYELRRYLNGINIRAFLILALILTYEKS
jgi:hypothetical protein